MPSSTDISSFLPMVQCKVHALGLSNQLVAWDKEPIDEVAYVKIADVAGGVLQDGPFVEDTGVKLFWYGTDFPPDQFTKAGGLNQRVADKGIVFRVGGALDDIETETAQCLALDIRGAAFFPFPKNEVATPEPPLSTYLYAVSVPKAVSTYRAQQVLESFEVNKKAAGFDWRADAATRLPYDPKWENTDMSTCVWQFGEYCVPALQQENMVACWKIERVPLICPIGKAYPELIAGGIRFCVGKEIWTDSTKALGVQAARATVQSFQEWYPREHLWLSYFGIVDVPPDKKRDLDSVCALAPGFQGLRVMTRDDNDWSNDRVT